MKSTPITFGQKISVVSVASIGVTLEWYDFFAAGTAAALVFPKYFFPVGLPPVLAILYSYVTFLIGFLGRPVGALIFGHIGDRLGRRVGLAADLLLMGLASLAIGFTPGYADIGYLGVVLVSIFRFIQGMAIGGEWGGAAALVQEFFAESKKRAFWGSWVQQGVPFGALLANGIFTLVAIWYPGQAFINFGWKIVFWIGGAAALAGVILRLIILETPLFERLRANGAVARSPIIETFKNFWKEVLLLAVARGGENANYYVFTVYSITFLTGIGMARALSTLGVTIASAVEIIAILIAALLADRIGRRAVLVTGNIAIVIYAVPYVLLLFLFKGTDLFFYSAAIALSIFAIIHGFMYAAQPAYWSELFPTKYRYTATGTAYHLTAIIAGGLAPIIITSIVGTDFLGKWWGQSIVIAAYALFSILAYYALRETKATEPLPH
jgi:MFS family permease